MPEARERTLPPRNTLFRRTDGGIPEIADSETARRPASKTAKRPRIKATFYLEPEDILAIDHLQSEEFRRTGKKPERSELVSRAIQEYLKAQQGHAR